MGLQKATQSAQDAEKILSAFDDTFDTENLEEQLVRLLSGVMHIAEEAGEDFSQCLVLAEEAYELEVTES
jgi:hypothetical protein